MKIKIDFVTNSSSETFGVVIADTATTIIASGAAMAIMNSAKGLLFGDASDISKQIAQAVSKEAQTQSEAITEGLSQAEITIDTDIKKLQDEIDTYKKQWEDSEKTADKSDPGYDKLKTQYDEYIKYLGDSIKEKDYQKYVIQVEKAEAQAQMESKNEWKRQRQEDYIAVKEETALLQATLKGYGTAGYDVKDIEDRLSQLHQREKDLSKTLSENDASIEYTPRDRGTIGPGAEFDKITKDYQKKQAQMDAAMALADEQKRAEIERKKAQAQLDYENAMKSAARWDMATKAAEGIQFGADMAVEGLSHVTGPAGQQIKLIYKASKNVASGMGEGMADPKNAGKHLAKGFIGAATEIVKDKFSESPFKSAIANTLNEGAQGALDAKIKGKDAFEGGMKGLGKGVIDSVTDAGLDKIKSKIPIPKGSSVEVGEYSLGKIFNNNPLTKGLAKTIAREGTGDKVKDYIKGSIVDNLGKKAGVVEND